MSQLIATIELDQPARLWALAVLALIAYIAWRSDVRAATWNRLASLGVRAAIVALLIVAFAEPIHDGLTSQRFVVFVKDASPSVAGREKDVDEFIASAQSHAGSHLGVVLEFGADDTDLAASVQSAVAGIPPDFVPQVVLLSDGNQIRGDLLRAALGGEVPVSVVPIQPFTPQEVGVARIESPARPPRMYSAPVTVVVTANQSADGRMKLEYRGREGWSQPVSLQPGENRVTFEVPVVVETMVLEATAEYPGDVVAENNRRSAVILSGPPRRALIVGDEEKTQSIVGALKSGGYDATIADHLPADVAALEQYDFVVLADPVAAQISGDALVALEEYVRDRRGGLIVVGGDEAFARERFAGTALENLLPVQAIEPREAKEETLALVLVIDRSASMREQRRMELAKEAAKRTVDLLRPADQIGIITFGDDTTWVAEITPAADKKELLNKIDAIEARGLTNMVPALEKAALALEQAYADRRHVILLTDGVPSPGDFDKAARAMAAAGMTVSTVSVGRGAEQMILEEISQLAGGRHYHCEDPADIPKVLERETRVATNPAAPPPFVPMVYRRLPGLSLEAAPPLIGYTPTSPRPDAELLLNTPEGDPLLSWRRLGSGVTVAMTASPGEIASVWNRQRWSGTDPFWIRLARLAARREIPDDYRFDVRRSGQTATITIDVIRHDGRFWNDAQVDVTLKRPGGDKNTIELPLVAPGRYEATADVSQPGVYEFRLIAEGDGGDEIEDVRGLTVDYPDELLLTGLNEPLLRSVASVTGGQYNPKPADVFDDDDRTARRRTPLWSFFVLTAALLLVVDVGLKRYTVAKANTL